MASRNLPVDPFAQVAPGAAGDPARRRIPPARIVAAGASHPASPAAWTATQSSAPRSAASAAAQRSAAFVAGREQAVDAQDAAHAASTTESPAPQVRVRNRRWRGTPLHLRTGTRLAQVPPGMSSVAASGTEGATLPDPCERPIIDRIRGTLPRFTRGDALVEAAASLDPPIASGKGPRPAPCDPGCTGPEEALARRHRDARRRREMRA